MERITEAYLDLGTSGELCDLYMQLITVSDGEGDAFSAE